jgi:hypothetical protein
MDALILPGFEVNTGTGATTLLGLRNTTNVQKQVSLVYFNTQVDDAPLRVDSFGIAPQATLTANLGSDLSGLEIEDSIASGLLLLTGGATSALVGDYIRFDQANAFASGGRLLRSSELCLEQELRFLDFGSGAVLRILVDQPWGDLQPSFSYAIYDELGEMVTEGDVVTSEHLNIIDPLDWTEESFGTIVFDFSASGGGWASGTYSAFGKFSIELPSDCRRQ